MATFIDTSYAKCRMGVASRRDESGVGLLLRHTRDGKSRTLKCKVEQFFREPGPVPGTIEDVGLSLHCVLGTHGRREARHSSIGASLPCRVLVVRIFSIGCTEKVAG